MKSTQIGCLVILAGNYFRIYFDRMYKTLLKPIFLGVSFKFCYIYSLKLPNYIYLASKILETIVIFIYMDTLPLTHKNVNAHSLKLCMLKKPF